MLWLDRALVLAGWIAGIYFGLQFVSFGMAWNEDFERCCLGTLTSDQLHMMDGLFKQYAIMLAIIAAGGAAIGRALAGMLHRRRTNGNA